MRRSYQIYGVVSVFVIAVLIYWRTAYPGISWWENGELAAAASVLGVVHPPGSLIPTVVGWLFLKLPLGFSPAFQLNILAGLVAACVAGLTLVIGLRLTNGSVQGTSVNKWITTIVLIAAGLGFAFSRTVWYNGTVYTPYIFTALFTAAIVWALLHWWETAGTPADLRWMFIIFLLVGLDISVHRTNALLIPGLGAAFLLCHWRTVLSWRAWLAGIVGLAVGLSFFLITMPMAAAHPALNANDPSTFGRFWDYFTVKQYGGGFLVDIYPRKGAFWSDQVADYLTGFFANFANTSGPLGPLGGLPFIMGIVGMGSLFQRDKKLASALLILFLCTSLGAIIYFNVPANYFRAMDRHYLPSFVIFGLLAIAGAMSFIQWLQSFAFGRWAPLIGAAVLLLMPIAQVAANFKVLDNSENYAAIDTGNNMLQSVPENGILIVAGDADTYAVWYLQIAERMRPDVTSLNISLLNTQWYVRQMLNEDSSLGITLTDSELAGLGLTQWRDTTIAIPLAHSFTRPDNTTIDTAHMRFPPTMQERYVLGQDVMIRRILCGNAWRRPVYASSFAFGQLGWLAPYSQCEGIVRQIMPYQDPRPNVGLIEQRFLHDYRLRGFSDSTRTLDWMTQGIGRGMWGEFFYLLTSTDDLAQRQKWRDAMQERLPLDRLDPPSQMTQAVESLCGEVKTPQK